MSVIRVLLSLFLLTAAMAFVVAFVQPAAAQDVGTASNEDAGEFENEQGQPPENQDSDLVPGLSMGHPTHTGSGCPQGTVSSAISPDQRTLSVLFDAYRVEAGGAQRAQTAECTLSIPFQVPEGYRVAVVKLDYRGFASVPNGAKAVFAAGYRFLDETFQPAPGKKLTRRRVFRGPSESEFALTSRLRGAPWSPCGTSFTLNAHSRLHVESNSQGEQVLSALDSVDAVTPVVYHLRWKKCRDDRPRRPRPRRA